MLLEQSDSSSDREDLGLRVSDARVSKNNNSTRQIAPEFCPKFLTRILTQRNSNIIQRSHSLLVDLFKATHDGSGLQRHTNRVNSFACASVAVRSTVPSQG